MDRGPADTRYAEELPVAAIPGVRWRARGRDGVEVDQHVVFAFMADEDSPLVKRFIAYWDPEEAVEELRL